MVRSSIRRGLALLAVGLALAAPARAQSLVYVLESGRVPLSCSAGGCHPPTIHLINAATGHDLASIRVGGNNDKGTSLGLSSDGRLLFVTTAPQTGSSPGRLYVVDAIAKTTLAQIDVGVGPSDVAVLPDTSRAYVVNNQGDSVSVVDLTSFTVTATIPVQHLPWRIAVTPTGNAVYVTNTGSASVSKISTTTNTVAANIGVGLGPLGLDISPDGSRLFVANKNDRAVSVIDANLDSVQRTIPAGTTSNPPIDVSAQSSTRVFVALDDPAVGSLGPHTPSSVQLLNAADGAVVGSTTTGALQRLARAGAGSPTYVIGTDTFNDSLARIADDGTSAATIAQVAVTAGSLNAAAVVTDPCAFEATATTTVFGPSGGSGVLTIPAPPGCAWTISPTGYPGLSVAAPLSGTGPGTRAFTVPSASVPRLGTLDIGRQAIALEQTIPRMNVEFAPGSTVQQPFAIGGWAFDENAFSDGSAFSDTGVDQLHVWAYPAGGGAPVFVGVASYGISRPDVAALFGIKYQLTGFRVVVTSLPSGSYTIVVFAHSRRSNTFSNAQAVNVTVREAPALIAIDAPAAGNVGTTFTVAGWAVDTGASSGTGVDVVHVWAYPSTGASPVFVGQAAYGGARPDVAAYLGPSFTNCGYGLTASLPPGTYTLVVFARSVGTGQFRSQTVQITVQ